MSKNTFGTRMLAFLLCLSMVFGILPAQAGAWSWHHGFGSGSDQTTTESESDSIVVIAGSDFQNKTSHEEGAYTVTSILEQIQVDHPTADGFLFAGDYDYNYDDSANGKAVLQETVQAVYPELTAESMVWVQGNHDADDLVGSVLSTSGAHDTADYGVYVINEQDYMWYNDDEATIQDTAEALKAYLDAKVAEGYSAPIFVMSHLPLHYSMRTLKGGGDGKHANYIFDVLNAAGAEGLNIIFMFGHNHSHGWDDYLGGAAIYLTKGDFINIAQNDTVAYSQETLNFTYMNAGYVGYYGDTGNGSDQTLTMTVFEITDSQVTVARYYEYGQYLLKAEGVYGGEYPDDYYASPAYAEDVSWVDSPAVITLTAPEVPVTVEDINGTGITVTAPGLTSLAVEVLDVELPEGYDAYVSYDISPEGYTQGDEATVAIPLDLSVFDESRSVMVLDEGVVIAVTDIAEGIVTFVTDHFSVYDVVQLAAADASELDWILLPGGEETVYRLTDSLVEGQSYVIVSRNTPGVGKSVNFVSSDNTINAIDEVVIYDENDPTHPYIEEYTPTAVWLYEDGRFLDPVETNRYLRGNNATLTTTSSTWNSYITWIYNSTYGLRVRQNAYSDSYRYLRFSDSDDFYTNTSNSAANRVYLYAQDTIAVPDQYIAVAGQTEYVIPVGAYDDHDALVDMVVDNLLVYVASDANGTDMEQTLDFTVVGIVDPNTPGTYELEYMYHNSVIATVTVEIVDKVAVAVSVDPMEITVQRGTPLDTQVGTITVTYADGTKGQLPLTLDRLLGTFDVNTNGTYTGLWVHQNGIDVPGITLHVVNVVGNDFPEYPDGGSVNVNKTVSGDSFQSTGVARVELSTSGLPAGKGADVIVMVDTSSSMNDTVGTSGKSRLEVMKESLSNLITQFNTPINGETPDIRVAVADFNNYYSRSNSPYYLDSNDHLTGYTTRTGSNNPGARVYTGSEALSASAFVDARTLNANSFDGIEADSGTNYDYAFDAIYQLGLAIQTENAARGESRDLFVIFMSDGAPYQYNYFSSQSEPGTAWNNWLTGTYANANAVPTNSNRDYYYNGLGNPHRMAEAVKGSPNTRYTVIRKNTTSASGLMDDVLQSAGRTNLYTLPGLGATLYSIGFCLATDKDVTLQTQNTVVQNLASSRDYAYLVDSADELDNAFTAICSNIRYAATNAAFEDQMGDAFDLQMNPSVVDSNGNVVSVNTDITVTSYPVYTTDNAPTADDVGKTYGTGTVVETVTFSQGGTVAQSNVLNSGNILGDDGVIRAKTFWYNSGNTAVDLTLPDGTTVELPAETFYWNIGTINEQQFTLSYAVYLTGSMEGDVDEGSYDTNNYATLSYTNWLGNEVSQSVPSPTLAWGAANVSYAFYLVDSQGRPVVNQTTGETGNIINAVKVTQPVLYKTINLNSGETVMSTEARDVLPQGYELYDVNAQYHVEVNSGEGGLWTIQGDHPATTYVTGYAGTNEYSNAASVSEDSYDYTHTTVYFAVKWIIGTVPDTVVVDFGLPVDINVLYNDMFGTNGRLIGVGDVGNKPDGNYTTSDSQLFGDTLDGVHGDIAVNGAEIRYTPTDMELNTTEEFSYEVEYTDTTGGTEVLEYYYGDVTVVPATTVYYEDGFLTYTVYNSADDTVNTDEDLAWKQVGDEIEATQDEDRPGEFSLSLIDANNIYGYDSAYSSMSTYSNGGAMKINVTEDIYGTAQFSFYGTGFDVVGLTSNTTGALVVQVTDENGTMVKSNIVDTYYGYTYNAETGEWVAQANDSDALYQVPVMKVTGLEYGRYQVRIVATYGSLFDHNTADTGYDLYLDAIRVYDPTGNKNEEINSIYVQDGEGWPLYAEIRDRVLASNAVAADGNLSGAVFIDGIGETAVISDYVNYGPNNELYLKPDQSITFTLDLTAYNRHQDGKTTNIVADVQLALKSADGSQVKYKIYNAETTKLADATEQTVSTTTDLYYSINGLRNSNVTISNTGGGILSLTNLKLTFTEDPVLFVPEVRVADVMVVSNEIAAMALMSMRAPVEQEPAPEPQPEPFAPRTFKVYALDKAYVGDKVIVTVTTSQDVAALEVNGQAVGKYYDNRWTKLRTWTTTVTAEAAGEMTIEAVAYNAEGLASVPVTDTVTVKSRSGNPIRDLFDWLFG